jgi:hypothetical protein
MVSARCDSDATLFAKSSAFKLSLFSWINFSISEVCCASCCVIVSVLPDSSYSKNRSVNLVLDIHMCTILIFYSQNGKLIRTAPARKTFRFVVININLRASTMNIMHLRCFLFVTFQRVVGTLQTWILVRQVADLFLFSALVTAALVFR